jgi:hypothetical protein
MAKLSKTINLISSALTEVDAVQTCIKDAYDDSNSKSKVVLVSKVVVSVNKIALLGE